VNKALEKDKFSMSYINGILKAWKKEGYPKEENSSGIRNTLMISA
jgi:DnaD/phage-associated family protein